MQYFSEKKAAAESAFENRSEEELNFVLSKCQPSDKQLVESIRSMKQQLGARKWWIVVTGNYNEGL